MGDIQIINLPDFGEFDDVEVIEVCVKEGQLVDKEEPIIVLETDKAAMEIPASVNGFIHKVLLKEGDKVKKGMPFLEIKIDPSTAKDEIKSNDLEDKKEELVPDENNIDQEISYKEKKNFNKKKNPDLWIRFLKIYRKQKVSFIWVKGHANNKENERCDFLAVEAADGQNLLTDQWYENNVANKGGSLF